MVLSGRKRLKPLFKDIIDGAQSNLIGSASRIDHLTSLFGGRVGASVDHFTNQRTLHGDSRKYQTIFLKQVDTMQSNGLQHPPAILVVDRKSLPFVEEEVEMALARDYHLTLRPVFQGGSLGTHPVPIDELCRLLPAPVRWLVHEADYPAATFFPDDVGEVWRTPAQTPADKSRWAARRHILRRFGGARQSGQMVTQQPGLPIPGHLFQAIRAQESLNLEPNGDLYLCMDMADSKQYLLGNALTGEWDEALWLKMKGRPENLHPECQTCSYRQSCQADA